MSYKMDIKLLLMHHLIEGVYYYFNVTNAGGLFSRNW